MLKALLIGLTATVALPVYAQTAPTSQTRPAAATYIQAGTLLDRPGQPPRGNTTFIVRDG